MAKVKHTKHALKAQRDALKRFKRYLPTLQLKKQQLQLEVRHLEAQIREREAAEQHEMDKLKSWVALFSEPFDFAAHLRIKEIRRGTGNIAGVSIPTMDAVIFNRTTPDLFATHTWVDDGMRAIEHLARFKIELGILREQLALLAEELRITNQRVNLFEKIKIPETKNNIRVIRVFLGDQQTAEVARAKLAKGKTANMEMAS